MKDAKANMIHPSAPNNIWEKGAELHEEWDDNVTIAVRCFPSYEAAEEYVVCNGIKKYNIYPRI